jgi:hypothetical protein
VAAGAVHRYDVIVGVNAGFHEAPFCRDRSARLFFFGEKGLTPKGVSYSRVARSRGNSQSYAKCQILPNEGRGKG